MKQSIHYNIFNNLLPQESTQLTHHQPDMLHSAILYQNHLLNEEIFPQQQTEVEKGEFEMII